MPKETNRAFDCMDGKMVEVVTYSNGMQIAYDRDGNIVKVEG